MSESPQMGWSAVHESTELERSNDEPLHDWQRSELQTSGTFENDQAMSGKPVESGNSVSLGKEPMMPSVHEFHLDAGPSQQFISTAGCHLSDLGLIFSHALQSHAWERHSKTLSTVQEQVFPLPLGVYPDVDPVLKGWLEAVLRGLNSLYGCGRPSDSSPTELQKKLVGGLLPFIQRMLAWKERIPHEDFSQLFKYKGVDYRGEEVKLARSFEWRQIEGALPEGVATLNLEDFCTAGCRYLVEDFRRFLLAPELQHLGRTPRVMVSDDKWEEVARGLIRTGICGVLPESQLHHVNGSPLLSGMFAVSKNETLDGVELHRLIMNLVPLNNLCKSVKGDVGTLPTIAGWRSGYHVQWGFKVLLLFVPYSRFVETFHGVCKSSSKFAGPPWLAGGDVLFSLSRLTDGLGQLGGVGSAYP